MFQDEDKVEDKNEMNKNKRVYIHKEDWILYVLLVTGDEDY